MVKEVLAALVLAVCVALLLRMLLGERLRANVDRRALGAWAALKRLTRWRADRREAARTAEAAIRRAQNRNGKGDGEWKGNVYRPKSFKRDDDRTD